MTTETIERQDSVPHVVRDPWRACEKAHATQVPRPSKTTAPAETSALACSSVVRAADIGPLVQRIETLETLALSLEQRLAVIEQGPLRARSHLSQTPPTNAHPQHPEPAPATPQTSAIATPCLSEVSSKAQPVAAINAPSPMTSQPLGTLAPEDWTRGLVTKQLVERLQTNPTTLKKYLRDLSQLQWAIQRDPEGLGWVYHPPLQCYYPLRLESNEHSAKGVPTAAVSSETPPEPKQHHICEPKPTCNAVRHGQDVRTGGLYQAALVRLTGIPSNTLQRWKQLPDCAERVRCRTEGHYCYWYSKPNKRFYPMSAASEA